MVTTETAPDGTEQSGRADAIELDGTVFAHPAYWRGHQDAIAGLCERVHAVLNGQDDGKGVANQPWEPLRRKLLALVARGHEIPSGKSKLGSGSARQDRLHKRAQLLRRLSPESPVANHFSCGELAAMALPGLPATDPGWRMRVVREGWTFEEIPGKGQKGAVRLYAPPPAILDLVRAHLRDLADPRP